jgi:hypothetical protein
VVYNNLVRPNKFELQYGVSTGRVVVIQPGLDPPNQQKPRLIDESALVSVRLTRIT